MDGSGRRGDDRSGDGRRGGTPGALAAIALGLMAGAAPLVAQETGDTATDGAEKPLDGGGATAIEPDCAASSEPCDAVSAESSETDRIATEPSAGEDDDIRRGAMIPREALVDMTRAQTGVICSSEIFLGCMGFDGTECLTLSESAIDQCLMTLPPEIDPTTLDSATLEACPQTVYEQAGYSEERALQCFEEALEGS